jgi:hypothetical protein
MGLFNPPPPTNGSSYPDIPVASLQKTGQQLAQGFKDVGWIEHFINALYHGVMDGTTWTINLLAGGMDEIFALFLKFISAAQGTSQPGFYALMSGVMTDLLGIEMDSNELISTIGHGGRLSALRRAGAWLYGQLSLEFDPSGGTRPIAPSADPATAFLGFLIEFAIRQGNVATFCEFLPEELNIFSGIREYGELLAKNLGLGRLARQALRPMMQILVADPLEWELNQKYRPKLPSEGITIKAYNQGLIDKAEVTRVLSWQGFTDQAIDWLINEHTRDFHRDELLSLWRQRTFSDQQVIDEIASTGVDDAMAAEIWSAWQEEPAVTVKRHYLTELLHEFRTGLVPFKFGKPDVAGMLDTIDGLHLTVPESNEWKHLFGHAVEFPRKLPTEAEMERAFLGGLTDMTTIQDYWTRIGYFPDDIQTLTLLLLQKQSTSNRTRAGHVAHKALTEAQLEKAYHAGILNLAQIQAGWHALGYSSADAEVLSALVQVKTPGPGETTLPGLTVP